MQALKAADIQYGAEEPESAPSETNAGQRVEARELCARVRQTLKEQSEGWKHRSIFERQWVIRDFKKTAGMPAEEWLSALSQLEEALGGSGPFSRPALEKLAGYYQHLADLAKGYEKNPAKLAESLGYVNAWKDEVDRLSRKLS